LKKIPLTQGQFALVDDDDYKRFGHLKWHAWWNSHTKSYHAKRTGPRPDKKTIYLAREIMGVDDPKVKVDHENHKTLDDRKSNLRACSNSQNIANRNGPPSNNKSGLRGVWWDKTRRLWRAGIQVNMKTIDLGRFEEKTSAASAYRLANRQHFGAFGGSTHPLK
jgi:hypothetical protein